MGKIRLLIIDEHRAVRAALETRLRSSQHINVIATANNLDECHSWIVNEPPDVILYGLKGSNGRESSPNFNAIASLSKKGLPIIILASYADDIQRERFLQAGAQRYLLKDINSSQLINEIIAVSSELSV